ncbi:type II toxin-antitoxin system ParD family antitoxin [Bradyrhizobium oligotrophicum]|uniref:type II toxin-antitoxin system ParD family antitoxin n=1 Tax=Bradyrhizobium oligotrophicum TaxID=44255 RepID=UPI003EBCE1A9
MASSYTIGKHYEDFIWNLVDSGRYATASEVMREGLRLIEEKEERRKARLEALRTAIQEGLDSGAPENWYVEDLIAEAQRRKAAHAKSPPASSTGKGRRAGNLAYIADDNEAALKSWTSRHPSR